MKRICGRILFDDGDNWDKGRHTLYALSFIVEMDAFWPEQLEQVILEFVSRASFTVLHDLIIYWHAFLLQMAPSCNLRTWKSFQLTSPMHLASQSSDALSCGTVLRWIRQEEIGF